MNNDYTRDEVIDLTLEQVDKWRKTPKTQLYNKTDHSAGRNSYVQTSVESELGELLHIYITEEWLQPHTEPLLDEIGGALGVLDTGVNRPKQWEYVFELAD